MMINIQKAYEVYILQINFVPRIVRLSFVTAYNSMKHLCWNKLLPKLIIHAFYYSPSRTSLQLQGRHITHIVNVLQSDTVCAGPSTSTERPRILSRHVVQYAPNTHTYINTHSHARRTFDISLYLYPQYFPTARVFASQLF